MTQSNQASSVVSPRVTGRVRDVVTAAASGANDGAAITMDRIAECAAHAVPVYRDPFRARNDALKTIAVLGNRRHSLEGVS